MNTKYIIPGVVAVMVVVVAVVLVVHNAGPKNVGTTQTQTNPGTSSSLTAASPIAAEQSITPLNTNIGSVAGVDLSEFATQANQSATVASQDGSSDAQSISSTGQTINSSIDSVNNPIQ